jgi:HEAT repeat protein
MTAGRGANEVREWVRRLGSRRSTTADAARARLAIIGGRAVEALIESLDDDNLRVRTHAMELLALIGDPRGREPLVAMLLDRDPRMREIAARCLARFPGARSVAALERLLDDEGREEVRLAVVESLVEQYDGGEERALCRLLELLYEESEPSRVRCACLTVLPLLGTAQRRGLLGSLREDADRDVARRAREIERAAESARAPTARTIRKLVQDLAAPEYAVWNESVRRLAACGRDAIEPLIVEMERRADDPEYCTRAGMALKALGPRRGRAIADSLDRVDEPLPLQVLIDVIGAFGERSMIYRLKNLIERLNGFDRMQRVRAKAHLELARIGSRVAIDDLHAGLTDPNRRCELEMLSAVELVGKRDEIGELLRIWRREDRFMRERIGAAVRTIMKRERIRRNNPMFRTLTAEQRRAFQAILPDTPRRRKPGSRARPRSESSV